jgi:phosphatidylinositol glycan class M
MMIPNIILHPAFGKVVFSLFDIISAALINGFLKSKKVENSQLYAWSFLFNPLVINLSTRGSADILVVFLVLGKLRFVSVDTCLS